MADTLDVLSLSEAKDALDIGQVDATEDANLERLITAVSRRLDKLVGPIVVRTVTAERHDGGVVEIELLRSPATSVTSVTEYDTAGASTALTEETYDTKPADGWLAEPYVNDASLYSGFLRRRRSGYDTFFEPGRGNVLVTYEGGRYEDTASVDSRFKEAAVIMLRNMWRPYGESTAAVGDYEVPFQAFPTYAVPQAVLELLHNELQPEVGFG